MLRTAILAGVILCAAGGCAGMIITESTSGAGGAPTSTVASSSGAASSSSAATTTGSGGGGATTTGAGGCAGGEILCDGQCVSPADPDHCGACGLACSIPNATPVCQDGVCAIGSCEPGFADCDGEPADGCEVDTRTDEDNCGACGHACPSPATECQGGVCQGCDEPGFGICDGDCIDTWVDPDNCGACGDVCSIPNGIAACVDGQCAIGTCDPGFVDCDGELADGCETDLATDDANCGACGVACPLGEPCLGGLCGHPCHPPWTNCDGNPESGCNVMLGTVEDCAFCGDACVTPNATPACDVAAVPATCVVGQCSPGYADCDGIAANGCEIDTSTDASNCGACGNPCAPGQTCAGGACQ